MKIGESVMVHISIKMMKILEERMDKGWFTIKDIKNIVGGTGKEYLRILIDMYVQGLVDIKNEKEFITTDHARRLLNTWIALDKPNVDPWIDSRIYTLLKAIIESGGKISDKYTAILEERGFVREGELVLEAYEAIDALDNAEKRLVFTKALAAEILSVPEGPAPRQYYNVKFIDSLEAMNTIVASIPNSAYYALTVPGRLLRRAFLEINIDAPVPVLLNKNIYETLIKLSQGYEVDEYMRTLLGKIGYVSGTGALTKAAKLVIKAWDLLKSGIETPPYSLSRKELIILKTIVEQWEKTKNNPEEAPTLKIIEKKLGDQWSGEYYSITLTLYHLESMGLVNTIEWEKKHEVYKLTRYGEAILKNSGGKPCSVLGSRALIEADLSYSPREDWINTARNEGLVGNAGPTKYGLSIQIASREAPRNLFLTGLEGLIIKRMPTNKSVRRDQLIYSFRNISEDILVALDKLESRGYVKTTPIGYITLTDTGKLLKEILIGVENGIATPISPALVKVLKAIKELRTDDIREIVNYTKLDVETVKKMIILARRAKYLGRGFSLTSSGEKLLDILKKINTERQDFIKNNNSKEYSSLYFC